MQAVHFKAARNDWVITKRDTVFRETSAWLGGRSM